MIDAKMLLTTLEVAPYDVYGVWIPRKGDNAILTMEVVENYLTDITFAVYTKNYEDPGDGVASGVSASFADTTGRQSVEITGCEELIRVKVTIGRNSRLGASDIGHFLYRFLQPVWFEAVA
jgi:hypothetical protein